jgi:hypothetical protein
MEVLGTVPEFSISYKYSTEKVDAVKIFSPTKLDIISIPSCEVGRVSISGTAALPQKVHFSIQPPDTTYFEKDNLGRTKIIEPKMLTAQANKSVLLPLMASTLSLPILALILGLIILATPFWWLLLFPTLGPLISGLLSLYFARKKGAIHI